MAYLATTELGTRKRVARTTVVDNADPAGVGTTTVTCTALPVGTKAIEGRVTMQSTAVGDYIAIREYGSSNNLDIARSQVANQANDQHFHVMLDSSRRFDYYASSANISGVYIQVWAIND